MADTIYSNVMLDLEAMGNGPNAAIVAIGAIAFDIESGELGPAYYNRVSLESAVEGGGVMDTSTVTWWLQQGDEARQEIARPGGMHINEALQSFATWLAESTEPDVAVWGNGASFDNVILRGAYQRAMRAVPWKWWNDRCYRTIKAQHRDVPFERLGTHHNALSDATSQAMHLINMLRHGSFDLVAHLKRQQTFSARTFGPGQRTAGVCDHIRKELGEIEQAPEDLAEWVDVVLLALDGAWRAGHTPEQIAAAIAAKQAKNEARTWPDWRTADPGKAIEHVREEA